MGKIFGILLIVLAIWVGLTIFNEGTDSAFGGLFAGPRNEAADASGRPLPQRVKENVRQAYQGHEERTRSGAED
jgi:hypothetical protein